MPASRRSRPAWSRSKRTARPAAAGAARSVAEVARSSAPLRQWWLARPGTPERRQARDRRALDPHQRVDRERVEVRGAERHDRVAPGPAAGRASTRANRPPRLWPIRTAGSPSLRDELLQALLEPARRGGRAIDVQPDARAVRAVTAAAQPRRRARPSGRPRSGSPGSASPAASRGACGGSRKTRGAAATASSTPSRPSRQIGGSGIGPIFTILEHIISCASDPLHDFRSCRVFRGTACNSLGLTAGRA